MKGISSALLSICCLVEIYLIGSNAHPTVFVLANEDQVQHAMPNKRAFDRLETSPFDFGAYSKRYSDDDSSFDFYRRKKSFDRLETSAFDFGYKRKRSFDGSAFDVVAKKRSVPSDEPHRHPSQPQTSHPIKRLSIPNFIQQHRDAEPSTFLYFAP